MEAKVVLGCSANEEEEEEYISLLVNNILV